MKDRKKLSLTNLILGYILAVSFIILMMLNIKPDQETIIEVVENNTTIIQERVVYKNPPHVNYIDRLDGVVVDDTLNTVDVQRIHSRVADNSFYHIDVDDGVSVTENHRNVNHSDVGSHVRGGHVNRRKDDVVEDRGLLDRRLREIETEDKIGLDIKDTLDIGSLSPVDKESDSELGDVSDFEVSTDSGYGVGKSGQIYAYNFPSRGVGAGVGSGAVGAGSGAGAGLGAGIGEAISDGSAVPTLGGVGTYITPGSPGTPGVAGGVGGLVGGAGAGGAAGLYTGRVTPGLGINPGGPGSGVRGHHDYEHLPENGALHIMMHVDGSGSILRTRKQLEIMKDTMLKEALLPYYDNDVSLYNRRVTIVDGSGERTLKFFTQAAQKDNVLAVVFQDEAQPDYHLPNFNKKPEDRYSDDLEKLKASLNGYQGLYRGVMFQVGDKVFSKSFKEFVENAWRGQGYLKNDNLSNYHWQENKNNIDENRGVVFSDEYHADPTGDPKYYLDLIFTAAKKVGLDLNIQAAGLTDGQKVD